MSVDTDYHERLAWLAELIVIDPKKSVRKLQRETLKYYPLFHKEAVRHWMSWRTAFAAADLANEMP